MANDPLTGFDPDGRLAKQQLLNTLAERICKAHGIADFGVGLFSLAEMGGPEKASPAILAGRSATPLCDAAYTHLDDLFGQVTSHFNGEQGEHYAGGWFIGNVGPNLIPVAGSEKAGASAMAEAQTALIQRFPRLFGADVGQAFTGAGSRFGQLVGESPGAAKTGERMFSSVGGKTMEPALLNRIKTAFEAKSPGHIFGNNPWGEAHLGPDFRIAGETLNERVIALRLNPSTSSVYEELIHTAQLRRGMTDVTQMEIEAAQKLIKFADLYKIPPSETTATIQRLKTLQTLKQ